MLTSKPSIYLIGEPKVLTDGLDAYTRSLGLTHWRSDTMSDAEELIEVMGRLCYRSFAPGLNPNVSRVREHNEDYLENILDVRHGSVIEHPTLQWIFASVSRVFTHEL